MSVKKNDAYINSLIKEMEHKYGTLTKLNEAITTLKCVLFHFDKYFEDFQKDEDITSFSHVKRYRDFLNARFQVEESFGNLKVVEDVLDPDLWELY